MMPDDYNQEEKEFWINNEKERRGEDERREE